MSFNSWAGIDSAAKFHECMHVMKKIVLQALDIKASRESEDGAEQQPETIREPQTSLSSSSAPIAVSTNQPTEGREKAIKIAKQQCIAETIARPPTNKDFESEMPILKKKSKARLEAVKEETIPDSHAVMGYYRQDSPRDYAEDIKKRRTHKAQKAQKATPDAVKKSTEKPFTMKEHLKTVSDAYEYSPLMAAMTPNCPLCPTRSRGGPVRWARVLLRHQRGWSYVAKVVAKVVEESATCPNSVVGSVVFRTRGAILSYRTKKTKNGIQEN